MKKTLVWTAVIIGLIALPFIILAFNIVASILEAILWVFGLGVVIGLAAYLAGRSAEKPR